MTITMKKKYSKCSCCSYYAKDIKDNKWKCARRLWDCNRHCIFFYADDSSRKTANEILERWIYANKD